MECRRVPHSALRRRRSEHLRIPRLHRARIWSRGHRHRAALERRSVCARRRPLPPRPAEGSRGPRLDAATGVGPAGMDARARPRRRAREGAVTRDRGLAIAAVVIIALGAPATIGAQQASAFPHLRHAEFFTDCLDCHAGIPTGEKDRMFPAPADCATCHDAQPGRGTTAAETKGRQLTPRVFTRRARETAGGRDLSNVPRRACRRAGNGRPEGSARAPSCHALGTCAQGRGEQMRHLPWHCAARVHGASFARSHAASAATSAHLRRVRSAGLPLGERTTRQYHPANFVSSHAPEAYGGEAECTSCHTTGAFCRDCHAQVGRSPVSGGRSVRFHNAQPL